MNGPADSNPRAASIRLKCDKSARTTGQRKHDLRHAPLPGYIDENRSHLNSILIKPMSGPKLRKICAERRSQRDTQRAMKSNTSVAMSGIIVFGKSVQADFEGLSFEKQNDAYQAVADTIAARLNTTVTGLVAHRDETAPHAHFQFPAYDLDGNALSMTTKRAVTSELQTITAEVMQRFVPSVERGRNKYERLKAGADYADTVHRSVAKLHEDLGPEIEAAERHLNELIKDAEKVAARIQKLSEKEGALLAKEEKRLAAYERRLKAKNDQVAEIEDEISRLSAIAEEQKQIGADAQRIADDQWDSASNALERQVAAEKRTEALNQQAERVREAAEQEKETAREEAAKIVLDARKSAEADVKAITRSMLKNDGREYMELKAEVPRLQRIILAQAAFIQIIKTVVKEVVPQLFERIARRVNTRWAEHPQNSNYNKENTYWQEPDDEAPQP